MCNINFMWRNRGITKADNVLLEATTYHSWTDNDHGEGYLTSTGKIVKSLAKISPVQENVLGAKWIIYHERWGTSGGTNLENTQPIETDQLVFIHNGMMNVTTQVDKSDSRVVAEQISALIKDGMPFVQAFKQVIDDTSGSKSIFVFDKKAKELYYYKNYVTSFYFVQAKGSVFASTSEENVKYVAGRLGIDVKKVIAMKSDVLMRVCNTGVWKEVEKVVDKPMPVIKTIVSTVKNVIKGDFKEYDDDSESKDKDISFGGSYFDPDKYQDKLYGFNVDGFNSRGDYH